MPRSHHWAWLLYLMNKEVHIMKIGTYFDDYEFACNCDRHEVDENGHNKLDHIIDKRLVDLLDAIRERLGVPLYINSGYRCPEHNAEVGGVADSQHVVGTAADITYDGIDVDYLAQIAEECGADGIGRYYNQDFVHVDVRGWAARWTDQD